MERYLNGVRENEIPGKNVNCAVLKLKDIVMNGAVAIPFLQITLHAPSLREPWCSELAEGTGNYWLIIEKTNRNSRDATENDAHHVWNYVICIVHCDLRIERENWETVDMSEFAHESRQEIRLVENCLLPQRNRIKEVFVINEIHERLENKIKGKKGSIYWGFSLPHANHSHELSYSWHENRCTLDAR